MARPKAHIAALMTSPEDIEAQFYEALQHGDLEKLMAVWADDDEIVCVHPNGPRVVGPAAIRASFEAIFEQGALPVEPTQVRRLQSVSSAVHHLVELVHVVSAEGARTASMLATNVYVKTELGWRLVAHHASAGQADDRPNPTSPAATLH